MPLRLWLESLDGATCWRVTAKLCRAGEDGENWTVEGGKEADRTTGTMDHSVSVGLALGAQGAMAMW